MPSSFNKVYTFQFWLLCSSSFLFFASFNMIIPELPSYLEGMGGGDYKGLIIALFTLAAGLSRPISGKLTDTVGRVPIMVYGVFVCIFVGFLYPVLSTVAGFLFLRFIHGMSTGFKPTATSAFIADVVPANRRGEAMGIMSLFGSLGMAAGPAVGGLIALHISINALFYTSSITALLSILVLIGMKETLKDKQPFSLKLLKIKKDEVIEPRVFLPAIILLLSVFSFGAVLTIIPDFSVHLGMENKGLFYTYFTLASITIRVVAGKASDRFGRVPVLKIGLVLLVISLVMIGFAKTPTELLTASFIFGLASGINSPTIFAWTADRSDKKYVGRAMATVYIALEAGIGSGSLLSSWVYNNNDDMLPLTFSIDAAVGFMALIILQVYSMKKKKQKKVVQVDVN
ncbi:MFS transporter [Chondrinema litorale]|uniref:MFS transporter n=1 Tax=Chondrinema litorale TaxID=2994555 RepID=UPI002543ABDF|nr:MFS transporter [Chondrinema litorale]UZR94815.1 MFS transporter [Chondrinema litorale]